MATSAKNRRRISVDGRDYVWWVKEDEDRWCDLLLTIASAEKGTGFFATFSLTESKGGPTYAITRVRSKSAGRFVTVAPPEMTLPRALGPRTVAAMIRWITQAKGGSPTSRRASASPKS